MPRVLKEREVLLAWPGLLVQQASQDSRVIAARTAFRVELGLPAQTDDLEVQVLEVGEVRLVLLGQPALEV